MSQSSKKNPVVLSIGLLARNEAQALRTTLECLLRQTIFEKARARNLVCEIVVVAYACRDRTAATARELLERAEREHPWTEGLAARVIEIPEAGSANAWNRFVHEFSAVETQFVAALAPGVVFPQRDAIYNLMMALERRRHIHAVSGRRCADLTFKERRTLGERLTQLVAGPPEGTRGRLDDQVHCLRASWARNLFLPRDLGGRARHEFIQEMVCTDILTRAPNAARVALAADVVHIYEAPDSMARLLEQEKRGIIGRTAAHVVVRYLNTLSRHERAHLADTVRRHESSDPNWLKKLLAAHLHATRACWRLYPDLLASRFKRLQCLSVWRRLARLPVTWASAAVTLAACARADRSLRREIARQGAMGSGQPSLSLPQASS